MSRRPEFFVPEIVLDKASRVPLYGQIYRQIAGAIRSGTIHYGTRLPSTRVMARLLGVSRNTVLAAYDDLAADDLVRGERGAGMRVNGAAQLDGSGPTWFRLRDVIRASGFPARVLALEDPDGNPLKIQY